VLALSNPIQTWFRGDAALDRFRRQVLGRRPALLLPRDRRWRSIAPGFEEARAMAASGLPFQIAADRRYDCSGDPRRLTRAMRAGATVFMPQIHQVLPRVLRLMVALRLALLGPLREECSFLFLVEGRGATGMGLHHDGDVDALWVQLEGKRTVTVGPPVPRGTPLDIEARPPVDDPRWATYDLPPGSLFSLPPRTPHEVVCHARSLALSLTWGPPRQGTPRARRESLTAWDVVSGRVSALPPHRRDRLWSQVPAVVKGGGRAVTLWTPDGSVRLPGTATPLVSRLALMPALRLRHGPRWPRAVDRLAELGILAPHDLPLRILPDAPAQLDGWRFG
jgi:JmjC domain